MPEFFILQHRPDWQKATGDTPEAAAADWVKRNDAAKGTYFVLRADQVTGVDVSVSKTYRGRVRQRAA